MIYFMVDKNGKLGHPTRRASFITKCLTRGTAKIVSRTKDSLTVKLLDKEFKDEDTVDAEYRVGLDPGVNHIGISLYKIFKEKITLLISGEAEIRSSDVTKNLSDRKMYRNSRRQHRRKNVIRKYSKTKFRHPIWKNRSCSDFRPTHNHLIDTHLNIIKYLYRRCPINKIHIEYAKFDTHKILNPIVRSFWYQLGPQYAFENIKSYIRSRDNYTCQICKKKCLNDNHVHHVIWREYGGSDRPDNLILLCPICHSKVHKLLINCPTVGKTRNVTQMGILNSCMKKLYNILSDYFVTQDTLGSIVKKVRLDSGINKTHEDDSKIIAFCDSLGLQDIQDYNYIDLGNHISIKQYRRHDRSWVKRFEDRKYYSYLTNKIVAWNRKRRTTQDKISLEEFRKDNYSEKVYAKSGGPTYRRSNTKMRFQPGDLIKYLGKYYFCNGWASTQCKVILDGLGKVRQRDCQMIRRKSGLVFI